MLRQAARAWPEAVAGATIARQAPNMAARNLMETDPLPNGSADAPQPAAAPLPAGPASLSDPRGFAAAWGHRGIHGTSSVGAAGGEGVEDAGDVAAPEAVPSTTPEGRDLIRALSEDSSADLTPQELVSLLDQYIIGQEDAKRAVAIAYRNRWRRKKVDSPLREDIVPKNMLLVGPTGSGKTEIARRLSKLIHAPFIKVEATKFTEVGFHGADVEDIIKDLVNEAVVDTRRRLMQRYTQKVQQKVEDKLIDGLIGGEAKEHKTTRDLFLKLLRDGQLEAREGEYEVVRNLGEGAEGGGGFSTLSGDPRGMAAGAAIGAALGVRGVRKERRRMKVSEARRLLEEQEAAQAIPQAAVVDEAIRRVEQDGIVFIDEIDKIVVSREARMYRASADASSEGVQRDLLPLIEGQTVQTRFGNVRTDHVLFICSGAFHSSKPSDMLSELRGRLPILVELKALTKADFYRILTEPQNSPVKQNQALLATEGVGLKFTEPALWAIAQAAEDINRETENTGARRLHTIFEKILSDISFSAPDLVKKAKESKPLPLEAPPLEVIIEAADVEKAVKASLKKADLSRWVI